MNNIYYIFYFFPLEWAEDSKNDVSEEKVSLQLCPRN